MRYAQNTLSRLARLAPRSRLSRSSLTQALAGSAIGTRAIGRRGSVLILVLGTLALLTVLAVVYVGIGKGDRQTARAIVARSESRDVPQQVADYLAGIIGDDALATAPSYVGVTNGFATTAHRREAWDAPYSDPIYRSNPMLDEQNDQFVNDLGRAVPDDVRRELLGFSPSGNHPILLDDASILGAGVVNAIRGSIDFDHRVGSDPWLASVEAVNLDLHLLFNDRDDGNLPDPPVHPVQGQSLSELAWYSNRDILQMSNFAPDGRAVNIFQLRNNFGAPSDVSSVAGGLANSISTNLTLFGDIFEPYIAGDPQFLWDSVTLADFNRPDHWFVNQRGAFRAMSDVDRGWGTPEFLPYQYADADGDGMVDSRWVELVDATDPTSPIPMLDHDGTFRYFVAVHVEDLSGRVNVNVAKSGAAPPTKDEPAGFTPADVDLARILSLEDPWIDTLWGYSGLEPPRRDTGGIDLDSPENYAFYDPFNTDTGPRLLQHVGQASFDMMQAASLLGVVPPQDVVIDLSIFNDDLYWYTVDEFRLDVLGPNQDGRERLIPSSPRSWRHSPFGRAHGFAVLAGGGVGGSYADPFGEGNDRFIATGGFGMDSLYELLSYNGVNNPDVTSDLEAAAGGRYDGDNNSFENFYTLNLDPFRSNRTLFTERANHDGIDWLYGGGIGGGGSINGTPDGITDADALLLASVDARRRLTTLSWARPLQSSIVGRPWVATDDESVLGHLTDEQANDLQRKAFSGNPDGAFVPATSELRTHIDDMTIFERASWNSSSADFFNGVGNGLVLVPLLENPKALFELYADALLPYSGVEGSWAAGGIRGGASSFGAQTLHYGYRGGEFALLTGAHMALNLIDAMDFDDVPTAATLLIDEQAFDTLDDDEGRSPDGRINDWAFWASIPDVGDNGVGDNVPRAAIGLKLDLNRDRNGDGDRAGENIPDDPEARLANSGGRSGEQPEAMAVNIFGIEAQPFITEVSTMFAYHDTPLDGVSNNPLGPGDDDIDDIMMPGEAEVTIDFSIRNGNPDFLFWVIAVQLTNPFDEPVKIGRYVGDPDDPNDREALYYLELNDNYFPLAGVPLDCYDYTRQECLGNPDARNGGGPGGIGGVGGGGASDELWSNPGIVIGPGESKVFLIPSQPLWFIEDRLEHRLGPGPYDPSDKNIRQIEAILEAQFGAPTPTSGGSDDVLRLGQNVSNIVIIEPGHQDSDMTKVPFPLNQYDGAQTATTLLRFDQLMAAPLGQVVGNEIPYELRLWRVMRQNSIAIAPDKPDTTLSPIHEFGGTGDASNLIENDLLVDRMHIDVFMRPGGGGIGGGASQAWFAVLDRRMNDPIAIGGEPIDNAETWNGEDAGDDPSRQSYDGLAIVSYATVSRPQDEAGGSSAMPLRVPWYAIEAKHQWKDWNGLGPNELWNEVAFEGDTGGDGDWGIQPRIDDVDDIEDHLYDSDPADAYFGTNDRESMAFVRVFDYGSGGLCRTGFETLVRMLGNDHDESGNADACADVNTPGDIDSYRGTTTGLPILEKDDSGREVTNNLMLLGGLRVEDLALELTRNIDRDSLRPGDFLLPLGVGAVYDPDLANGGANPQWTTLSEMLARVLGFDDVLDDDGNGLIDDDLYARVGAVRTQDAIAANGAITEFGVSPDMEPVIDPSDPLVGRPPLDKGHIVLDDFVPFLDGDPQGAVVFRFDPTDGDIAFGMRLPPAIVLLEHVRTLFGDPAVGPNALDGTVPGAVNINTASRTVLRALPMLSPSRFDWWGEEFNHDVASDIASTVQAYRDKIAVHFREDPGPGVGSASIVSFAEFDADEFNIDENNESPRQHGTIVSGLPEERGIRSVGELALMRSLGRTNGDGRGANALNQARKHNIDRLGYDDKTFGASEGIETVRYGRHVGTVRNENTNAGIIIGDFGLDERDDYYVGWTLTFLASDEQDLVGKSFVVTGYYGDNPQQRKAREIRYDVSGNTPRPKNGDVFVLSRAAQGTVQIFDPTNDERIIIATGEFDPEFDYAGSTIVFHGSSRNPGGTFQIAGSQFFSDGRAEFTLSTNISFDMGGERPVVGSSFVVRPQDYANDLPGTNTIAEDDRIEDEFDERLAILNSVINTASVRSDLYAVWFLLHGYQESDVAGLGSEDPMLPTIQRRFVMVVDRSNVKAKGDKPEILLFKEVPL